jgi:hypothetical protein
MQSLIGKRCECTFSVEYREWPIAGSPAFVVVEAVDMPMIKMLGDFDEYPIWVSASIIKTIREIY